MAFIRSSHLSLFYRVGMHVFIGVLLAIPLFLVAPRIVHALQATLAWSPNQETDLAGYKLYYGSQSHTYTNNIDVGNVTTYTAASLPDGSAYYFALTAYNSEGAESGFSQEVSTASSSATAASAGGAAGAAADSGSGGGGGGGCFIATALYGPESREVFILRQFRDTHLLTNRAGSAFVTLYYKYSPPIARVMGRSLPLRILGKGVIGPLVYAVGHLYLLLSLFCAVGVFVIGRKVRKVRP